MSATPQQWLHFADTLGFREHLLPVVVADVPIHSRSKLSSLGKTPSRITQEADGSDCAVGMPAWTKHKASERDIDRWAGDGRHGICMQARAVRAIDIDIAEPEQAARVRETVLTWLRERGLDADVRGRADASVGKCLVPVLVEGALRKRILKSAHGAIEFLADGQQWIAVGPRYVWSDSDGLPVRLPTQFPALTPEQFEELWALLADTYASEEHRESEAGMVPTKPRRLADARAAGDDLAEWLAENGHAHEWETNGKLRIRCPFADAHTGGEDGDGSTVYFPAGVGGFERGHFRCLHAHCAGRSDGDFITALGYLDDDFEPIDTPPAALADDGTPALRPAGLVVNSRTGLVEPSLAGICAALRAPAWSGVCVVHDQFDRKTRVRFGKRAAPASEWSPAWLDGFEEFYDGHVPGIILALVAAGFAEPGKERVWMAVQQLERESRMDSAQAWLQSLTWDGTPRIDRFFTDYWQCSEDPAPYVSAVSRYFWLGLAGRLLWPGCKADMMVVVKGQQGCGKSRGAAACAPPGLYGTMNFSERSLADSVLYTKGRVLIEFAELAGLSKRESEAVKDFLSQSTDTYRMRFERNARDWPRRALFLGTTNEEQYLNDPTGHRRWLPLAVGDGRRVAVEAIDRDRDQLWAEAAAALAADGGALVAAAAHAERLAAENSVHAERVVIETGLTGEVEAVLAQPAAGTDADFATGDVQTVGDSPFTLRDVMRGLGIAPERMDRRMEMRVSAALRALGYSHRQQRVGGKRAWWWEKNPLFAGGTPLA